MADLEQRRSFGPAVDSAGSLALYVVLAFTAANALFNTLAAELGFGFPYTSFLMLPSDRFADFFKIILSYPGAHGVRVSDMLGLHDLLSGYIAHNPYYGVAGLARNELTHFHLPPFTTLLSLTAIRLMHHIDPVMLFVALAGALLLYLSRIALLVGGTWRRGVVWALLGALNYPMLAVLTRGNLFAGVTALILIHALLLAVRGKAPVFAGLLLALAINIRPNAGLFVVPLLLLYPPRDRVTVAVALLSAIAICAISLLWDHHLYPDYDFAHFTRGVEIYYQRYVFDNEGVAYGSSLYGGAKLLIGYHAHLESLCAALSALLYLAAIAAYTLKRLDRPTFLFLMCASYCLGSSVFGDYHLLIFLIVPMVQAMEPAAPGNGASIFSPPVLISCIMLSPKNYLFVQDISYQVLFNPLLLLFAAVAMGLTACQVPDLRRSAVT
jgi:hypothetical protein